MSLTLNEAELDGEFGGDLGDDVGGEVAGDERRVAHHVVHRVGHLHQLAVGEVWKEGVKHSSRLDKIIFLDN